jgi:peptide-methionine (S)-S-oxide reductase
MKLNPVIQVFATLFVSFWPALAAAQDQAEVVVLGAGCFWCVEAIYERQPGVLDVVSGYAGGNEANPSYSEVSAGRTGHAEVVQIRFDPTKTSYQKLLELFWKTHDPTDGSGVWPDYGPQYRSIILYATDAQRTLAEQSRAEAQKKLPKPIATQIVSLKKFYQAEEYHQDYVRRHPSDRYVQGIAIPKLQKLGLGP